MIFLFLIFIFIWLIFLLYSPSTPSVRRPTITPEKIVGNIGEMAGIDIIQSILREDDILFTNVPITFKDKQTELDAVIMHGLKYIQQIDIDLMRRWLVKSVTYWKD